jgi:nucleotide-binding universal stress UspA family protein
MMPGDLLVHIDARQAGRRLARIALDLAAKLDARVTGLHVKPPAEAPPLGGLSVADAVEREIAVDLEQDAVNAEALFREEAAKAAQSFEWRSRSGDVAAGICAEARFADLVIVGQDEFQGPAERHPLPVAHSVVLHCGRPVLIAPSAWGGGDASHILIAWDGSREAVRAVHDAMPLLRIAKSVEILAVSGPGPSARVDDIPRLSGHLERHGVIVSSESRRIASADEHGALRRELERGDHQLLVMGGYSHPMWLEFVAGGVTQSILMSSQTPILASH